AAVLGGAIRAPKKHNGGFRVVARRPPDPAPLEENLEAGGGGASDPGKQIEKVRSLGGPGVVAGKKFPSDTANDGEPVRERSRETGAQAAVEADHWARGGAGATELARAVVEAAEGPSDFRFLYPLDAPIKAKIEAIATGMYGAGGVSYTPEADRRIRQY